jgi:hypothetical protein
MLIQRLIESAPWSARQPDASRNDELARDRRDRRRGRGGAALRFSTFHHWQWRGASGRPPVAAVIIEAPSMLQARMTAVARRLAPGAPFGDGVRLTTRMVAKIPPERIGRMQSARPRRT